MAGEPTPFVVEVADEALADLRERLAQTRWPEAETVEDWSQGLPLAYARELCEYWRTEYDMRRVETRLNALPQFRADIDGLGIHFLHVRSPHADALPLLLTHGRPGWVVEFLDVIGPLRDTFHVVCPSLPGYGFSDKPTSPGWSTSRIADAWAALMDRLGYARYGAQGGDWGAAVTTCIGQQDVDHLAGIHLNMPMVGADRNTMDDLTDREKSALESMQHYQDWDSGYSKQQSTRPQTLGYGLVDSPAGQCAWIVEKFWAWTDCNGHPENALTRDELLDNVMLYWIPGTGASSARMYWESFRTGARGDVTVPVGCSIFPKEIFRPSRRWAERRFSDIRYWNELDKGGHFAAFERPETYVEEVRNFLRLVR